MKRKCPPKPKIGDRFDHLEVIAEVASECNNQRHVKCRCDCGREVNKNDYRLRMQSLHFKACGYDDCKFSKVVNHDQDMSFLKKDNARRKEAYVRKVTIDNVLAHNLLSAAWR